MDSVWIREGWRRMLQTLILSLCIPVTHVLICVTNIIHFLNMNKKKLVLLHRCTCCTSCDCVNRQIRIIKIKPRLTATELRVPWFSPWRDKGCDDLATIITIMLRALYSLCGTDVRRQVSSGREAPTVSSPLSFISLSLSNQLLLLILLYSSLAAIVNKHF